LFFAGVAPKTVRGKTAAPAVIAAPVAIDINACRLVSKPLFVTSILLAIYILKNQELSGSGLAARHSTNRCGIPVESGFSLLQLMWKG
jgi:hypothetical protein